MNFASLALLTLLALLLFFDYATLRRRGRRVLALEVLAFAAGGFLIASPDTATRLAHLVGIGRGVDFVLYPLVIWLVRESLHARRRNWEATERLTHVVRAMALASASDVGAQSGYDSVAPSSVTSTSTTGTSTTNTTNV